MTRSEKKAPDTDTLKIHKSFYRNETPISTGLAVLEY